MKQTVNGAPIPTEADEQKAVFAWAAWNHGKYAELALMYHIPNEGKRSPRTGAHLKAQGLKPGVPDIHLPVARGGCNGLFIELKALDGKKPTDLQLDWMNKLRKAGNAVALCYGADAAIREIEDYLNS